MNVSGSGNHLIFQHWSALAVLPPGEKPQTKWVRKMRGLHWFAFHQYWQATQRNNLNRGLFLQLCICTVNSSLEPGLQMNSGINATHDVAVKHQNTVHFRRLAKLMDYVSQGMGGFTRMLCNLSNAKSPLVKPGTFRNLHPAVPAGRNCIRRCLFNTVLCRKIFFCPERGGCVPSPVSLSANSQLHSVHSVCRKFRKSQFNTSRLAPEFNKQLCSPDFGNK